MAIDPTKAAFLKNEYRYETVTNDTLKTKYKAAQEIIIETNLSKAAASALKTAVVAETDSVAQAYKVTIDQVIQLEDFDGGVPHFQLYFPAYQTDTRIFKMIGVEVDFLAGKSIVTVRG